MTAPPAACHVTFFLTRRNQSIQRHSHNNDATGCIPCHPSHEPAARRHDPEVGLKPRVMRHLAGLVQRR
jgi:hypothetical protein